MSKSEGLACDCASAYSADTAASFANRCSIAVAASSEVMTFGAINIEEGDLTQPPSTSARSTLDFLHLTSCISTLPLSLEPPPTRVNLQPATAAMVATLDYSGFPHVFTKVLAHCNRKTQNTLRLLCYAVLIEVARLQCRSITLSMWSMSSEGRPLWELVFPEDTPAELRLWCVTWSGDGHIYRPVIPEHSKMLPVGSKPFQGTGRFEGTEEMALRHARHVKASYGVLQTVQSMQAHCGSDFFDLFTLLNNIVTFELDHKHVSEVSPGIHAPHRPLKSAGAVGEPLQRSLPLPCGAPTHLSNSDHLHRCQLPACGVVHLWPNAAQSLRPAAQIQSLQLPRGHRLPGKHRQATVSSRPQDFDPTLAVYP